MRAGYRIPAQGFSLEAVVDRLVQQAVRQTGGNVSAAARLLGVSRDVVRYRLNGRGGRAGEGSPGGRGEVTGDGEESPTQGQGIHDENP